MADIFNRNVNQLGGVFVSEKALLTIAGAGNLGLGALVQNVSVAYQQQFQLLFELGSNSVYPIMGRPQGSLTIGRIVGDGDFDAAFYNPCDGGSTVRLSANNGNCFGVDGGSVSFTLNNVFVTSYGVEMTTADLMVKENVAATFISLEKD